MASITLWVTMTTEVDALLGALVGRVAELREGVARTRFGIALGSLQSETVGRFACELLDGGPGAADALPAIKDLVAALRGCVADAAATSRVNARLAATVADEIRRWPSSSASRRRCWRASRPWPPPATTRRWPLWCRGCAR